MREGKIKKIIVCIGMVFCLTFCLFPFIYMLAVSLSTRADFLSQQVTFKFTLDNFRAVLTDPSLHFLDYLRNSIVVSLLSAFFCVAVASLSAYAITRLKFPGKMYLLFFALAVSMFPQIGLVGYLFKFMTRLGWINTYQGLLFPYTAWILPLSLWILVSYFSQIPRELDKAALVDGCTYWQSLRKIILPVAAPGVLSVFLLSFILAFKEFMLALMLSTD
jgi:multiple sugar transport system permease protein